MCGELDNIRIFKNITDDLLNDQLKNTNIALFESFKTLFYEYNKKNKENNSYLFSEFEQTVTVSKKIKVLKNKRLSVNAILAYVRIKIRVLH